MNWFNKLFKKKQPKRFETESDLYAYLGSIGVSTDVVVKFQNAKDKIKAFEKSDKDMISWEKRRKLNVLSN